MRNRHGDFCLHGLPPTIRYPLAVLLVLASTTALAGSWQYSENKDEMRGTTQHVAFVVSDDHPQFGFPYDGGSTVELGLRFDGQELKAYLFVDKGQFDCTWDDYEMIAVRFDNRPVQEFRCHAAKPPGIAVFFHDPMAFFQQLKTASKVIVEVPFYGEGRKQLHFSVSGLQWR